MLERGADTLLVAIMVPTKPLQPTRARGPGARIHGRARTRAPARNGRRSRIPPSPTCCGSTEPRSVEVLQEREYVRIKSARPVLVYAGRRPHAGAELHGRSQRRRPPARRARHAEDRRGGHLPAHAHPGRDARHRHGQGRADRLAGAAARSRSRRSASSTAAASCASSSSASAPNGAAAWSRRTAMAAEAPAEVQPPRPRSAAPRRWRRRRASAAAARPPATVAKAGKDKKGKKEPRARRTPRARAPWRAADGPSVAAHPRAARAVARAKGWGGLAASCSAATCRCPPTRSPEAGCARCWPGSSATSPHGREPCSCGGGSWCSRSRAREQQLLAAAEAAASGPEPPAGVGGRPGARVSP